jgi:hypothetical protein
MFWDMSPDMNLCALVNVAWKSCTPIFWCFDGVYNHISFCNTATLPAFCHSLDYICHFDMTKNNIRRHLREEEYLRAVRMVQQEATFRKLRISLLPVRHTVQGFRQQLLLERTLQMMRGSVFPRRRRRLNDGNFRLSWPCIRTPLTHRYRQARSELTVDHTW